MKYYALRKGGNMMPIKIEIEDGSYINDSANNPYRMKLFMADKGPEEVSKCDNKKQRIKSKARTTKIES